ncbi:hypothetical protein [Actinosynnema sp. NPDC023587]
MTAITMTGTRTGTKAPAFAVALHTTARFAGHFLAALVGVAFLGRHVEH